MTKENSDFALPAEGVSGVGIEWAALLGEKLGGKITDEMLRGHRTYFENSDELGGLALAIWMMCFKLDLQQITSLVESLKSDVALDHWIALGWPKRCSYCARHVRFETNGLEFRAAEECAYAGGILAFTTEFSVPSGKMVADDYLHSKGDFYDVKGFDIMTDVGTLLTGQAAEKKNFAHGFCGNSCPGIFQKGKNGDKFLIGRRNQTKTIRRVGGICTDLWWYSLADYEEFLSQGGEKSNGMEIISCKPGVYKVTHHGHYVNRDVSPVIFAEVVWDREIGE